MARFIAIALAGFMCLTACSTDKKEVADAAVSTETAEEKANALFDEGMAYLEANDYSDAIKNFQEIEKTFPYVRIANTTPLMIALAYFKDSEYEDALTHLDRFISMQPTHERISYAYYLRAMSYYERIADVKRDQDVTRKAKQSLEELIRRFPSSSYAKDAKLKLDLVVDHLAGKEMEIGRFYLHQEKWVAAINRFKTVLEQYNTTSHSQEALYRLTEAYISLGIIDQAQKYAAILGHNFPESKWYHKAYRLVE